MKIDQSFMGVKLASALGMLIAAVLIVVGCVLPLRWMNELNERILPSLENAIAFTQNESTDLALTEIDSVMVSINKDLPKLMLVLDHKELEDLYYSIITAQELAKAGDRSQLLTELTQAETTAEFLLYSNDLHMNNLF